MNTYKKRMIIRIFPALMLISALLLVPVMGAPMIDRDVSLSDKTATIKFTVSADEPFAVGIVETIPAGWTFADNDNQVSSSKNFETDRTGNKIAFYLSDEKSASYELTGEGDGKTGFKTEWVNLLTLSPDIEEGKERWMTLGDDSASENINDDLDFETKKSPGFGILAVIIAFITTGAIMITAKRKEA